MVLTNETQTVKSNLSAQQTFGIEANAAAFKILTDKLYQYPIRAIVRELATNAIDACVAGKKDLGDWELVAPSHSNPIFAVIDHGVGMTEEHVYNVYTKFFSSTKSNSNEQTGMFGLGSKTPFAYTKQFVIDTTKDGVRNVFNAFIDESGLPALVKVGTFPGTENGTKIQFAVNEEDFTQFFNAIEYSSRTWPSMPKITSDDFDFFIKTIVGSYNTGYEYLVAQNNAYKSFKIDTIFTENYFNRSNISLEMGSVLYNVSSSDLPYEVSTLLDRIRSSAAGCVVIHAPIGAVSITPSREELQYDEKTKKFIYTECAIQFAKYFNNKCAKLVEFKDKAAMAVYVNTIADNYKSIAAASDCDELKNFAKNVEYFHSIYDDGKLYSMYRPSADKNTFGFYVNYNSDYETRWKRLNVSTVNFMTKKANNTKLVAVVLNDKIVKRCVADVEAIGKKTFFSWRTLTKVVEYRKNDDTFKGATFVFTTAEIAEKYKKVGWFDEVITDFETIKSIYSNARSDSTSKDDIPLFIEHSVLSVTAKQFKERTAGKKDVLKVLLFKERSCSNRSYGKVVGSGNSASLKMGLTDYDIRSAISNLSELKSIFGDVVPTVEVCYTTLSVYKKNADVFKKLKLISWDDISEKLGKLVDAIAASKREVANDTDFSWYYRDTGIRSYIQSFDWGDSLFGKAFFKNINDESTKKSKAIKNFIRSSFVTEEVRDKLTDRGSNSLWDTLVEKCPVLDICGKYYSWGLHSYEAEKFIIDAIVAAEGISKKA